jgi:hypothetical protein
MTRISSWKAAVAALLLAGCASSGAAEVTAAAGAKGPEPQARYCRNVDAYRIQSCAVAVLPATPLGRQLAWTLDQLGGDAATLTEAEVREHVSAEFLTVVMPPEAVIRALQGTLAEQGPLHLVGHPDSARPWPSSRTPAATGARSRSASPPASRP